jgi:hypothetical protein
MRNDYADPIEATSRAPKAAYLGLHLRQLDPFIGALTLDRVHSGPLQPFIEQRSRAGVKVKSINNALGLVRGSSTCRQGFGHDEHGLTWLENAPLIQLRPDSTAREPYPLDWEEQPRLFRHSRIIWPGCACSRSTQDVANRKCADLWRR